MNNLNGDDFATNHTAGGDAVAMESKIECFVPVLIKQMLDSADECFQMCGKSLNMVTVAIVRSIDATTTKITYRLEDHTGCIEGYYWLHEGDERKVPEAVLNNYVKVYGNLCSQGEQITLKIFNMIPISDDDVCKHILEALDARYKENSAKSAGRPIYGGFVKNQMCSCRKQNNAEAKTTVIKSEAAEGVTQQDLPKQFSYIKKEKPDSI